MSFVPKLTNWEVLAIAMSICKPKGQRDFCRSSLNRNCAKDMEAAGNQPASLAVLNRYEQTA